MCICKRGGKRLTSKIKTILVCSSCVFDFCLIVRVYGKPGSLEHPERPRQAEIDYNYIANTCKIVMVVLHDWAGRSLLSSVYYWLQWMHSQVSTVIFQFKLQLSHSNGKHTLSVNILLLSETIDYEKKLLKLNICYINIHDLEYQQHTHVQHIGGIHVYCKFPIDIHHQIYFK